MFEDIAEDRNVERSSGKQVDERASVQVGDDDFLAERTGLGSGKGVYIQAGDLAVPLF